MAGREIGTFWLGGPLSWIEQLCLKSFLDHGHPITVFSKDRGLALPDGVALQLAEGPGFFEEIAREAIAAQSVSGRSGDAAASQVGGAVSALATDLFRLHLLASRPGMIWVNPDMVCLGPLDFVSDHLFGYSGDVPAEISAAVLALPADAAVLADLLAFTGDPFAIAPYLKPRQRRPLAEARAMGKPVHVRDQPAGAWGSRLVDHFVVKHGLQGLSQAAGVLHPLAEADRALLLQPARRAEKGFAAEARTVRLWPALKDDLAQNHGCLPPAGSFLAALVRKHGIDAMAAPVHPIKTAVVAAGRASAEPSDLIGQIGVTALTRFADLGGNALEIALYVHARFDCDLCLIDADSKGGFPDTPSAWVAPYVAALRNGGVALDRITVVRSLDSLRPVDLLCNFGGYGDRHKIRWIEPFLAACLHADSTLVLDIRKGSGGYPFLAEHGETETLSKVQVDGNTVARVLFRPKAPEIRAGDAGWAEIARGLAGDGGFYRENTSHSFLFIPRGRTLVVTFDNLDIAMNKREDRRPWGFSFIEKQGWSMLGVMANGWTWYRDPWVSGQFDDLASRGFFAGFERVVFYGASMGGYAACAFSGAAPGADVVAISPQSTVDKTVVPWETRYKTVWGADFSGPYGDAALVSGAARRVTIIHDPFEPLDAGHANRFGAPNVMKLRANLLGHRLGSSLQQMGVLNPIILGALTGTLTEADFYRALRARRTFPRYQRELFSRALAKGHAGLAKRLGAYILRQGDNRFVRQAMEDL